MKKKSEKEIMTEWKYVQHIFRYISILEFIILVKKRRPDCLAEGRACQARVLVRWTKWGRKNTGRGAGCTKAAMQNWLGAFSTLRGQ